MTVYEDWENQLDSVVLGKSNTQQTKTLTDISGLNKSHQNNQMDICGSLELMLD